MPQLEYVPSGYIKIEAQNESETTKSTTTITLQSTGGDQPFRFTFEAVRPNLFRTTFTSETHPLPPYPSAPRPQTNLEAVHVRQSASSPSSQILVVGNVEASVDFARSPVVSLAFTDRTSSKPLHADLEDRSYVVDGEGVAHYCTHDRKALHCGLGEKNAPFDLTARKFEITATDSFGYEVYHTDPLYKHMPFLIKATSEGCVGIFSTSHSRGSWAVGSEIDGLWGHFKAYRQDYGGLEEYLITGRTLADVCRTYAEVVGFPLLAPRWAYGYISGGYKYAMMDSPPAHQAILDFAQKLKDEGIPCSAHQISSGYSIAETEPKVRNVFTWNKHRFPNPAAFVRECHEKYGMRLLTNIKPFLLESHPSYAYLKQHRGFFTDTRTGEEGRMKLWSAGGGESGMGGSIDFTSAEAFQWWRNGVKTLRTIGIDGMWNDNNEYTIPNDRWEMNLRGWMARGADLEKRHVGLWGRAMHTELMGRASYEGLLDVAPAERPFVLTRSATVGSLRYCASSWSGDNQTSWEGMKGANALSLNAGISLMHCYGHDIGGFEGPQPSPELLLRWIQLGCYQARFAINCFKTSPKDNSVGEVIEPWMYPEITPLIRKAVKRRYEMMPYIYSLSLAGHTTAIPLQRWIGWGYESDPEVWTKHLKRGEEQYWFGDALLVGGVYEPGKDRANLYLPRQNNKDTFDYGYVNLNEPYQYFASGQWVEISSPWKGSIPVLAKVGSAIPIGKDVQTREPGEASIGQSLPEDDWRGIEIFPPPGSSHGHFFETTWYEDDGVRLNPQISAFTISYSSTQESVTVRFWTGEKSEFIPPWSEIDIILPCSDSRHIVMANGSEVAKVSSPTDNRVRYRFRADGNSA